MVDLCRVSVKLLNMRVSISGASNTGKSTLINAFIRRWPMYETPKTTYRDVIKEENLDHSANTNEITQLKILQWMLDEQDKYNTESNVIYDRCPWDALAYTLQASEANLISDEVTAAVIDIVKASLKNIDIIFWLQYDPDIKVLNNGVRETDLNYIKNTDQIFSDLFFQYSDHLDNTPYYLAQDTPAIIKVEGKTVDDRIGWIAEFLGTDGKLIDTNSSILAPENLDLMEQMLKEQGLLIDQDNQFKNLTNQIKNFKL